MAAVAVTAAASACSSSVSIDDFSSHLVTAECQYEVKCGIITDQTFCEAFLGPLESRQGFGSLGATLAAAKAGKIAYDGTAASQCLDSLSSLSCNTPPANFGDLPGCAAVFTGTLAEGASCITMQECKTGSVCQQAMGSTSMCAGVCTAVPDSCRSSADCSGGKVCGDSGTCVTAVPAGASGQPCGTSDTCQSGLYCAITGQSSTCQPIAQGNQSCTISFSGNSCATGFMCIQTDPMKDTGTCLTPKTKGQACQYAFECGGTLSPLVCDPSSKTCVDRPKSGACIQGTCAPLSAYCDVSQPSSPTCKAFKALGEACMSPEECGIEFQQADCVMPNGSTSGTCTSTASQACTP